jgi:hypothetical protein
MLAVGVDPVRLVPSPLMAALAGVSGCAAAVLVVVAATASSEAVPLFAVAVFVAVIAAVLATSSVSVCGDMLVVRTGPRSRVIPRSQIDRIGITTVNRTKLCTVGITVAGENVGISCLQRLPTQRSRAAIGNQAIVLLSGRLDGDRRVPWSTDAVADEAWQVFERIVVAAHRGHVDEFTALARATIDLPARTAQRLSIYTTVVLADLVTQRVGPVRDPDVLARLNSQIQQRYTLLFPDEAEPGLRNALSAASELPAQVVRDASALLVEAGTAAIGCLLSEHPYTELSRMRTKMSGWLLTHAAELPAHLLVPTRLYSG